MKQENITQDSITKALFIVMVILFILMQVAFHPSYLQFFPQFHQISALKFPLNFKSPKKLSCNDSNTVL